MFPSRNERPAGRGQGMTLCAEISGSPGTGTDEMRRRMTCASKKTRALAAAALLLPALSCGPKVVVARLATPTAGVSVPAATATSPPLRRPDGRRRPPAHPDCGGLRPGRHSHPPPEPSDRDPDSAVHGDS